MQDPVLEVGDARGLDGPDLLESHIRVPEVVEEATTPAEDDGYRLVHIVDDPIYLVTRETA